MLLKKSWCTLYLVFILAKFNSLILLWRKISVGFCLSSEIYATFTHCSHSPLHSSGLLLLKGIFGFFAGIPVNTPTLNLQSLKRVVFNFRIVFLFILKALDNWKRLNGYLKELLFEILSFAFVLSNEWSLFNKWTSDFWNSLSVVSYLLGHSWLQLLSPKIRPGSCQQCSKEQGIDSGHCFSFAVLCSLNGNSDTVISCLSTHRKITSLVLFTDSESY